MSDDLVSAELKQAIIDAGPAPVYATRFEGEGSWASHVERVLKGRDLTVREVLYESFMGDPTRRALPNAYDVVVENVGMGAKEYIFLNPANVTIRQSATQNLAAVPAGGVARETGEALPSVLSQTHITGKGVTAERLYERINMGNGVPSIDPPGTTYGDLQKQGRTHFAFDPEAEVISLEEVRQLPDKYPEYFKRIPREGTRLELIEPISPLKHAHPPDDTGLPGPVRLDESVPLTVHADAPVHVPSEKPWTTLPPPNLGDDVADELAEKVMTTRNGMTTKLADLMSSNLEDAQEAASSVLLRDIMDDPPTTEQVAAVQRYLRERTQEFLSPLPDEVTVYRFGNLDRPGVASLTAGGAPLSFTLNPRYNYREGLPWSEAREVAGERFVAYTVKKSDIELAMDMRAGKAIGEDELLIHPSNVRPVPAG